MNQIDLVEKKGIKYYNNPFSQGLWDKKYIKVTSQSKKIVKEIVRMPRSISVDFLQEIFNQSVLYSNPKRYRSNQLKKHFKNELNSPENLVFELVTINKVNTKLAKVIGLIVVNKNTKNEIRFNCLVENLIQKDILKQIKSISYSSFKRKCNKIS